MNQWRLDSGENLLGLLTSSEIQTKAKNFLKEEKKERNMGL